MEVAAADLAHMAQEMATPGDVSQTLQRILATAQQVTSSDAVGVFCLERGGKVDIAAFSEPTVQQADELQLVWDQGPCLDSLRHDAVFLITDTMTESRWPVWGPQVAELGWRSIISAPLVTPVRMLGSLNLYSRRTAAFTATEAETVGVLARFAATALAAAVEADGLRQAVNSRNLIGQAQGILMERYDLDADHAFNVLRRYSQHSNIKLRTVAKHLIATRLIPGAEEISAAAGAEPQPMAPTTDLNLYRESSQAHSAPSPEPTG